MIELNFRIDDDYLITHTLSSMRNDRFSSAEHRKEIKKFEDYTRKRCKQCYDLITRGLTADNVVNGCLRKTCNHLPEFLNTLRQNAQFREIRRQTEEYLEFCNNQWNNNLFISYLAIRGLTGLNLDEKFTVYITHPSLRNGMYCGDNMITWGHHEDWPNYATIYLWHEVLHSYFVDSSDMEHAVIELIADEELRARLNGIKYPPFVGHQELGQVRQIKIKILPYWKKYLKLKKRDIREFIREIHASLSL